MSEYNTSHCWAMQDVAMAACERLELDPFFYVPAHDQYGNMTSVPRWQVVAEEMRRFVVYSTTAREI